MKSKEDHAGRDLWYRWSRWTSVRGIVAAVWMLGAIGLGLGFTWRAAFVGGDEPGELREVALRMAAFDQFIAAGLFAVGPLGVWIFRRRPSWLVAAVALFVIFGAYSLSYLLRA